VARVRRWIEDNDDDLAFIFRSAIAAIETAGVRLAVLAFFVIGLCSVGASLWASHSAGAATPTAPPTGAILRDCANDARSHTELQAK
jgi:hypothetical protein